MLLTSRWNDYSNFKLSVNKCFYQTYFPISLSGASWVGGGKKDGYLTWDNGDIFSDLNQVTLLV